MIAIALLFLNLLFAGYILHTFPLHNYLQWHSISNYGAEPGLIYFGLHLILGLYVMIAPIQHFTSAHKSAHKWIGLSILCASAFLAFSGIRYILCRGTIGGPVMTIPFVCYGVLFIVEVFNVWMSVHSQEHPQVASRLILLCSQSTFFRVFSFYLETYSEPSRVDVLNWLNTCAYLMFVPYLALVCNQLITTPKQIRCRVQNSKVLIIGGGIAGLYIAGMLRNHNVPVTVVEKNKRAITKQGYGLGINKYGVAALQRLSSTFMDLLETTPVEQFTFCNKHGKTLLTTNPSSLSDRKQISREQLHEQLWNYAACKGALIYDGVDVQASEVNGLVEVFCDGNRIPHDVLICADGANSRTRKLFFGESSKYTGFSALTANEVQLPKTASRLHEVIHSNKSGAILGSGGSIFFGRNHEGSLSISLSLHTKEAISELFHKDRQKLLDSLPFLVPKNFVEIAKCMAPSITSVRSYKYHYCLEAEKLEKYQNVFWVGDAMHLMPPYLGLGANVALHNASHMVDAILSGNFTHFRKVSHKMGNRAVIISLCSAHLFNSSRTYLFSQILLLVVSFFRSLLKPRSKQN